MIFTSKKSKPDDVYINIDGHEIDEVKCTKFLGVYIDNKISWKKHIDYTSGKVSRGIGIILRARHLLNRSSLKRCIIHLCTRIFHTVTMSGEAPVALT